MLQRIALLTARTEGRAPPRRSGPSPVPRAADGSEASHDPDHFGRLIRGLGFAPDASAHHATTGVFDAAATAAADAADASAAADARVSPARAASLVLRWANATPTPSLSLGVAVGPRHSNP